VISFEPNINGEQINMVSGSNQAIVVGSGALTSTLQWATGYAPSGSGSGMRTLSFDASKSNSIYTDSGKVYPLSLALNFIIKS
jgi:hypothetical protein